MVLLTGVLTIGGCRHSISIPDVKDFTEVSAESSANRLRELRDRSQPPASFRGSYELRVAKGIEREVLRQAVVYEAPANLRIDTFASSFKKLVSLVISADGVFNALDAEHQIIYTGASTPRNIGRLAYLPLTETQYASWVLGLTPVDFDGEGISLLEGRDKKAGYAIRQSFSDGRLLYAFLAADDRSTERGPLRFLRLSVPLEDGGTERITAEFRYDSKRSPDCPPGRPQEILFSFEKLGFSGSLTCEKLEENPDLRELRGRLFTFRAPAAGAAEVRQLD